MYLRTLLIVLALGALALFTAAQLERFHHADDAFGDLCQRRSAAGVDFTRDSRPVGGFVSNLRGLFAVFGAVRDPASCPRAALPARACRACRNLAHPGFALLSRISAQDPRQANRAARKAETSAKLDRLESELRQSIEQCHNSLAASMAEIDDRLEHGAGDSQARKLT